MVEIKMRSNGSNENCKIGSIGADPDPQDRSWVLLAFVDPFRSTTVASAHTNPARGCSLSPPLITDNIYIIIYISY